jgi:hypothetical protein
MNVMPKKRSPPPGEKPQKQRFAEAAKAIGADETGKAFERAMKSIVPSEDVSQVRKTDHRR